MPASLADLLREWHDFYMLVGTASATLVGLMFVSASIGASIFNENHRNAMRAFVSPTVVHFSALLFACVLIMVPSHTWMTVGVVLGTGGLVGLVYSGLILSDVMFRRRYTVDLSDRFFYALIPVAGYALVVASAVMLIMRSPAGLDLMAAALLVLLVAAIRNAWDMTIWAVIKSPGPLPPPMP
jgi:hypothetical protein